MIDFWKNADCDDFHIVSDVIGQRIIITEESIAKLFGLKFLKGKRVHGLDNKSKAENKSLDQLLFTNFSAEKSKYKRKDLHSNLKVWHKIIWAT